jgi:hypothetical protein
LLLQCGPRAWYGRFICKAFGIPTWGVRQPGHAAMTRWTINGWDVCLGGGLWKSWWDDQCGLDFLLESQARAACISETMFLQKVYRLQWLAQFYFKENTTIVRRDGQYDPGNPWYSLSMIQRQHLSSAPSLKSSINRQMFPPETKCITQLERTLHNGQASSLNHTITFDTTLGSIIIPATSYCNPTNKIIRMPCFLGGDQLFVKDDAEIEYQIEPSLIQNHTSTTTLGSFTIICVVATAHRTEQAIELLIGNSVSYVISMPYTMGLWGKTTPLIIELDITNEQPIKLQFKRPKQNFGFAFREFQLIPNSNKK